ncbi:MAG: inorganic phosphate transporter [Gammaproteobacteria bacterium]|jgi:PiT family inorganic phosphate transporter|nr:inorganic phosphate transporter [Gammaproteobacteria bacterium]MDH3847129.1 inorganic phosphate transporter [Gammaproteobacteria bacterium]MDH3862489.1 inorganic phosphate transporter [Gammaproteobacteria bacterium]MDH3906951.1 inorganic phosphate transporter [Gammaproteobacteria bacterium]MDH4003324.1 inorganic phosphate transporter [Gammaproteobacteria bacterium]
MEAATIYIVLAAVFGLFMAWGIGANDVANAMATSVGSKALTIKQAILVAAVFEFLGAVLAGGEVTSTIRKGIVDAELLGETPELLVYGMLAALLAAGTWLFLASHKGWPVSTTHSIVGAIVGFAAVGIGVDAVRWEKVGTIVMSWVVSPLTAGFIAFLIYLSVQRLILRQDDPLARAKRFVPVYIFLAAFTITLVTILKGLKHVGLEISIGDSYLLAISIAVVIAVIGAIAIKRIQPDPKIEKKDHFYTVEKVFGVLMVVTACSMAFAHGSNDVANAIGPLAAVISVASTGAVAAKASLPLWVLMLGGGGIVIGLATYGIRVIATVGRKITQLTPSRGFAAELAAATTIVIASGTGIPISTTHTLVGAVLGVGLARGIEAIDLRVVTRIFVSWVITIPAGAFLAILFFFIFKAVLP